MSGNRRESAQQLYSDGARARVAPVLVRLSGGLGNQLFQLSAGHVVAGRTARPLFLDTRFLGNYDRPRRLEIDFITRWLPGVQVGSPLFGLSSVVSRLRVARFLDLRWGPLATIGTVDGVTEVYASRFSWIVLDGYFQHPACLFDENTRVKLRDRLIAEYGDHPRQLMGDGIPTVGIHIRRGDYVSSKAAAAVYTIVPLAYYREAVRRFDPECRFLVFSDDDALASVFAREIGGIDIPALGLSLQDEFCLLAQCDHFVIANSTFSWWASFLGFTAGKRILSPRNWYVNPARNDCNPLLLPRFELIGPLAERAA